MTDTTPLSPAAQAVVAAIEKFDWETGDFTCDDIWILSREVTAAALRAAADQVVPGNGSRRSNEIRADLLAIADELGAL